MRQDGAHDSGVLEGGDDAQPAAASGIGQDIESEHAAHQRHPGPGTREAGRVGGGLEGDGDAVRGRADVPDDLERQRAREP